MSNEITQYDNDVWEFFESRYPEGFETANCLFCKDGEVSLIKHEKSVMQINSCSICGFVYNKSQPTQATLEEFYKQSRAVKAWSRIKAGDAERQYHKFIGAIDFLSSKKVESVFDVGCGNGAFLQLFRDVNKTVKLQGCDPSPEAVKMASKPTIKVSCSILDEIYSIERFDAITFWGVLEHVKNPEHVLDWAYKRLQVGGYIVACVPNLDSAIIKTLAQTCFTYCPQHLWYFNVETLSKLFRRSRFRHVKDWTIEGEYEPIVNSQFGYEPYSKKKKTNKEFISKVNNALCKTGLGYKIIMIGQK